MRVAAPLKLTDEDLRQLESWSRGRSTPQRLVIRSRIVLKAAGGLENRQIAEELGIRPNTVGLWRNRFALQGLKGIVKDAHRAGRKPSLDQSVVSTILERTLHGKPEGETHWSTRNMARAAGVSHMTVQRVWKAHGLQPHRYRSFKFSKDVKFEEKLMDVIGLYRNPPARAVVFSIDEKPQIQALERTQRILPLRSGMPQGISNDYKRNGTIDLFAALNTLDGTAITQFHRRHTHKEFICFLKILDSGIGPGLEVHVVLDNLSAHKTPEVLKWLKHHPRFHFHFTPTSSSWVNMVEG